MKFFRTSAPGLVALAVLLCVVPAFASPALDAPDANAPEIGEVLNDDSAAPSVSGNDTPAAPDTVPDTDGGGADTAPAPAVTTPDADFGEASDTPAPTGDDAALGDSPSDSDGDGTDAASPGDDAAGTTVPASASVVECSGSDVTINLDDRAYTSVVDVGGFTSASSDADTSTLSGFLRAMFGTYTPKTQVVTTYFDGEPLDVSIEYVPGIAGMDMEWIASVLLFGIVVYCLFRLLGGMVR